MVKEVINLFLQGEILKLEIVWFFDIEVTELKFRKINDEAIPITTSTTSLSK